MKKAIAIFTALILVLTLCTAAAENETFWTCPSCGTSNTMNFCTECGTKRPETIVCGSCGYESDKASGYKYCPNCGAKLETGEQIIVEAQADPGIHLNRAGLFFKDLNDNKCEVGQYVDISFLPPETTVGIWYILSFDRNMPEGCTLVLTDPAGEEYRFQDDELSDSAGQTYTYTAVSSDNLSTLPAGEYTLTADGQLLGTLTMAIDGNRQGAEYFPGDESFSILCAGAAVKTETGSQFFPRVNLVSREELPDGEFGVRVQFRNNQLQPKDYRVTLESNNGTTKTETTFTIRELGAEKNTALFMEREAENLYGEYTVSVNGKEVYRFVIADPEDLKATEDLAAAAEQSATRMVTKSGMTVPGHLLNQVVRLKQYFGNAGEPTRQGYASARLTASQAEKLSETAGENVAAAIAHQINSLFGDSYTEMADLFSVSGSLTDLSEEERSAVGSSGAKLIVVFYPQDCVVFYADAETGIYSAAFVISSSEVFSRFSRQDILDYASSFGIENLSDIRIVPSAD